MPPPLSAARSKSSADAAPSFTPVTANPKRKRRLVPDSQRKRIAVSCDRCRTRKLKCQIPVLTTSSGEDSPDPGNEVCSQCLKAGVSCTRTMPRKQRVYGSVDSLSTHYQALVHVLSQLYPGHDVKTLEGLKSLSQNINVPLPETFDPEEVPQSSFLAPPMTVSTSLADQESSHIKRETTDTSESSEDLEEVRSLPPSNPQPTQLSLSVYNPFFKKTPSGSMPFITPSLASPSSSSSFVNNPNYHLNPVELGCERIIYDRSGLPHYVGAIGSMAFFDGLCKIIRRSKVVPSFSINGDDDLSQAPKRQKSISAGSSYPLSQLNRKFNNPGGTSQPLVLLSNGTTTSGTTTPHHLTTYYGKPASSHNHSPKDIYFCTISSATFSPILQLERDDAPSSYNNHPKLLQHNPRKPSLPRKTNGVSTDDASAEFGAQRPSSTSKYRPYSSIFGPAMGNNTRTTNNSTSLQVDDTVWDLSHHGPLLSREEADKLVDAYFEKVHPLYTLFSMKDFRSQYASCWDSISSSRTTKICVDNLNLTLDWRCVLYMVFVMGARVLIKDKATFDYYSAFAKYTSFVQKSLFLLIATPSIHTIQALFLFSIYLYSINERNIAWLITGIACRLSIAMGLHRESTTSTYDHAETQVRKMVWWALYSLELHLSANLGRPSTMRDEEIDVSTPNSDPELDLYYPPGGFKETIRMVQLLNMTIHQQAINISTNSGMSYNAQLLLHENMEKSIALCRRIKDSLGNLPKHLREMQSNETDLHVRSILNIHMNCHYCISIVARPYILYLIGSDPSTLTIQQRTDLILLLNIGCAATTAIASILSSLHRRKLVSGVFYYDIYHGYCAIMVLALASLIISSKKFDTKELAYDLPAIYKAINTIVTIMDSLYLDGTLLRLGKVSAYILRDLGIDYKGLHKKQAGEDQATGTPAAGESEDPLMAPSSPRLTTESENIAAFENRMDVDSLERMASTIPIAPAQIPLPPQPIPVPEALSPASLFSSLQAEQSMSTTAPSSRDSTTGSAATGTPETPIFDFHSFFTADDYERMFTSRDILKGSIPATAATTSVTGSATATQIPEFADAADIIDPADVSAAAAPAQTLLPVVSPAISSPLPGSSPASSMSYMSAATSNMSFTASHADTSGSPQGPIATHDSDSAGVFAESLFPAAGSKASQYKQSLEQYYPQQQQIPTASSYIRQQKMRQAATASSIVSQQDTTPVTDPETAAAAAAAVAAASTMPGAVGNPMLDAEFVEALNTFSCTIESYINPSRYTTSFKIGNKNDAAVQQGAGCNGSCAAGDKSRPGTADGAVIEELGEEDEVGVGFASSSSSEMFRPHQQIIQAEESDVLSTTAVSAAGPSTLTPQGRATGVNNNSHQFTAPPSPSPLVSHLQTRLGLQQPYQWISGGNLLESFYDAPAGGAPAAKTEKQQAPGAGGAGATQQVMLNSYDFVPPAGEASAAALNISGGGVSSSGVPSGQNLELYGGVGMPGGSSSSSSDAGASMDGAGFIPFLDNGGVGVISSISAWSGAPDHGKNLINYVRQKLK